MSRKRKAIPLEHQLAAALACLLSQDQRDALRTARAPAKAVIRLFTMHHLDYHALGGADHWSNLDPLLRQVHEDRFPIDVAVIAKVKRIQRKHGLSASFVAMAEVIDRQMVRPKRKIAQRENPWPKRSLRATRKPNVRQIADGR